MMRVIYGHRKTSRTTALIEMAAELERNHKPCYIVVHNQEEVRRVAQKAREMSLIIGFPITYDEFMKGQYNSHIHALLIDNADKLLAYMSKVPLAAIVIEKRDDGWESGV